MLDMLRPNRRHFAMIAAGAASAALAVPSLVRPVAAQAASEGAGDVFQMLIEDHQKISEALQQIKQAEQPETKMKWLKELDRMLLIHDLAEGLVVYPALRGTGNFEDVAAQLYKEHADIKTYLFTLQTVSPTEALWTDSVAELEQLIKGHVQQEEQEAFPEYQQAASSEWIQALSRMAQQKRAMVGE